VRSKVVPSLVQTGCTKGWRETEQKLNGSRLNEELVTLNLAIPDPVFAEYASSDAHSEWVI
jgi:hypothetical protein